MRSPAPRILQITLALIFVLAAQSALAQVTFTAQVDRNEVALGETVRMDVTLQASSLRVSGMPRFANLDGFEIVGRQSSTSLQIINGRATSTLNYVFLLMPNKPGEFTVGPLEMNIGGKTYTTQSIEMKVLDPGTAPRQGSAGSPDIEDVVESNQPVFMIARVEPKEAVIGQQVIVTYEIYSSQEIFNVEPEKYPNLAGFLSEEISSPRYYTWEHVNIAGKNYRRAVLHQVALFPLQTGALTIDSMVAQVEISSAPSSTRGYMFMPFGQAVSIASPPETLIVGNPPAEDQPADYSGAVGPLLLTGELSKPSAPAHTPVTLRLSVEGEGNYRTLDLPNLNLPEGFRVYSADGKEDVYKMRDSVKIKKTYEILLIGEEEGLFEIGPIELTSWNPELNRYEVAKLGPFELNVTPGDDVAQVIPADRTTSTRALLPNRPDKKRVATASSLDWLQPGLLAVLAGLPLLNLMVGLVLRRRRNIAADEQTFRRHTAGGAARQRLKAANRMAKENPAGFYSEMMRSILGFIADRCGTTSQGQTRKEISELLESRGVDQQIIGRLLDLWDEADQARFGGAPPDDAHCKAALKEASDLINSLNRNGLKG